MSEMIERLERCLYEYWADHYQGLHTKVPFESLSEVERNFGRGMARAAIEAMREPTEAMIRAAYAADQVNANSGGLVAPEKAYPAMIDAALD